MQFHSVSIIAGSFERRRNNTGLLHGITGFLLVLKTMDWVRKVPPEKQWLSFFFLGAGLLAVTFGLLARRLPAPGPWSKRLFVFEGICFLALTCLFFPAGRPVDLLFTIVWTLLCAFFFYTEKRIEKSTFVTLNETGIQLPGLLKDRLIPWEEVESVVLRTDFLTINRKNNKYIQYEVAEEDGVSFREAFNKYAQSRINNN